MAASSKWSKRWPGCGPTRSSPISTGTAIPRRPPFPSPSTRRSGPGGSAAAICSSSPRSARGSPGPARPSAGDGSAMLAIDLKGKRAFVAGVSDDGGFGFAIAKALAEAGATVCVGTWPPTLGIFTKLLERGKIANSLQLSDGRTLQFERIYPLDAAYDSLADAPADVRENKRYKDVGDFSIQGVVARLTQDFGARPLDIVVHSLANAPEVKQPLIDTSRRGYLEALSVSAYSNIAFVRSLGPLLRPDGSFLSLTYMAGERVIPGYGGGMSSAKAALEADTRTLAYEAGRRFRVRVNAISAGPRAAADGNPPLGSCVRRDERSSRDRTADRDCRSRRGVRRRAAVRQTPAAVRGRRPQARGTAPRRRRCRRARRPHRVAAGGHSGDSDRVRRRRGGRGRQWAAQLPRVAAPRPPPPRPRPIRPPAP